MSAAAVPSPLSLLFEHWTPAWEVLAAAAAALGLYATGLRRLRRSHAHRPWPTARTLSFAGGVLVVVVALQSGVDDYDDRLLSVHMVQHLLLLLLAPLLLLLGQPVILALRTLAPSRRARLLRLLAKTRPLGHPAIALAVFSLALIAIHVPPVFDAAVRHPLVHIGEHALLIALGLLYWWPLLGADPSPRFRLGGLGRVLYLLASMPPMALIGAYLNRATTVVYPPYAAAARVLGISAVNDQQQAGAIMWVAGSSFMIAAGIWLAMAAMIEDERRLARRERNLPADALALPTPLARGKP